MFRTARSPPPPAPNPFAFRKPKSPIKEKIPATTESLEQKLDKIWAKLEDVDRKLEGLDSVREINEKVEKLDLGLEQCKREQVSKNLIIVGLDDKEKETYAELERKVVDVFKTLNIGDVDYSNIRRLGKYTQDKRRSIQVKLMRQRDKVRILKAKKSLKSNEVYSKIYINPELTQVERNQQATLLEAAKKWKAGSPALKYLIRGGRLTATLNNETHIYRLNDEGQVEEIQQTEEDNMLVS